MQNFDYIYIFFGKINIKMGNSNSDYYRTVGIEELQRKDKADFKYIWVDLKVNGAENKLYLNRFK